MDPLNAISPIDGRYLEQTLDLSYYFSETALMKYRLSIEIRYLIALSKERKIPELPKFSQEQILELSCIAGLFSRNNARRVKELERETRHDVKAIEYFLREQIRGTKFEQYASFIHFGLTSEDINNLAHSLAWRDSIEHIYLPLIANISGYLYAWANQYRHLALLAMTHGQPATPTTVGKELAVYAARLDAQIKKLRAHKLDGKLNGATGTFGAHVIAYPKVNWPAFSKRFIRSLGLHPKLLTTQVESYDSLVESYQIVQRINTILIDFTRDMWLYISRGVFHQKKSDGEVGSSTMPHKINPIDFENAEGNCGIANALLAHLASVLPVSRMQRDLSGSTALRNQGVALAHSLLACRSILRGLNTIEVDIEKTNEEIRMHWEVLGEAIQTILRKYGQENAYEKIKNALQKKHVIQETISSIVADTNLPKEEKQKLFSLFPQTYIGLAESLCDLM